MFKITNLINQFWQLLLLKYAHTGFGRKWHHIITPDLSFVKLLEQIYKSIFEPFVLLFDFNLWLHEPHARSVEEKSVGCFVIQGFISE